MAIVVTGRDRLFVDRDSESHSRPVAPSNVVRARSVGSFHFMINIMSFRVRASSINFTISISLTNESHAC